MLSTYINLTMRREKFIINLVTLLVSLPLVLISPVNPPSSGFLLLYLVDEATLISHSIGNKIFGVMLLTRLVLIVHARTLLISFTTWSMDHVLKHQLVQFRIFMWVRDFS